MFDAKPIRNVVDDIVEEGDVYSDGPDQSLVDGLDVQSPSSNRPGLGHTNSAMVNADQQTNSTSQAMDRRRTSDTSPTLTAGFGLPNGAMDIERDHQKTSRMDRVVGFKGGSWMDGAPRDCRRCQVNPGREKKRLESMPRYLTRLLNSYCDELGA